MTAGALRLRDDARVTKGSGEDGSEGVTGGVMDGGMEADAMRALDEVTSIGAVLS